MTTRLRLSAALGLSLLAGQALAEGGPPRLDVEATCQSAQRAQVSISDKASLEGCLRSERSAHDELKKRWSDFPASAKTQCSQQFKAGGAPSYVELVTCLELASGTVPAQSEAVRSDAAKPGTSDVGGAAGAGEKKAGSRLTREPPPTQRTNPIDVLNDK
ncbi:hypothetical protein [Methylobacterium sp. Leaf118]|uniref:hypothetical protein n=1 Tax=Methylobacterium sp. Leaf118 TaxID=2876562 RepID=UPI001E5234AE|nr:hypothetical protein [Methylobacterium sp. Leaf118]